MSCSAPCPERRARARRFCARLCVVVLAYATSACQSSLAEPNAADAAGVPGRLGQANLSELQQGRSLYLARCGTCHALRDPASEAPGAWGALVQEMRTQQGVHLSDDDARRITAYLVSISSRN